MFISIERLRYGFAGSSSFFDFWRILWNTSRIIFSVNSKIEWYWNPYEDFYQKITLNELVCGNLASKAIFFISFFLILKLRSKIFWTVTWKIHEQDWKMLVFENLWYIYRCFISQKLKWISRENFQCNIRVGQRSREREIFQNLPYIRLSTM